jgi:nucleoside-diphosphate-sugar epimerase
VRFLVTGAGGFLGGHVVDRLLERNHSVRVIVRPKSSPPRWNREVDVFPADLRVARDLSQGVDGIDTVIHLAAAVAGTEDLQFASSVVGTERLLQAMARSSVKRLVHVSSIVVYDWSSAANVMDEKTPLVQNPYEMGGYTIAKVWQERLVTRFCVDNGCALTIMRPGFIWGPGNAEIGGMGRRAGRTYLTFGVRTRLPLSHVLNCADCIVAAAEAPMDGVNAYNVVDTDNISVWRYVKEYRQRAGSPGWIVPIPYYVGLGIAKIASTTSRIAFGKRGKLPSLLMPKRFEQQFRPFRFSNEKIKRELGWIQRYTFGQCLDFSYGDARHHG